MALVDFLRTSLIDFPGRVASVAYVGGCNFRCPYCQNGDLVLGASRMPALHVEVVLSHLKKRKGLIDGLVVTGGEATLWPHLPRFLERVKTQTGVSIKLDTNGTSPAVLAQLIANGWVDAVAMDLKHHPQGYPAATGMGAVDLAAIENSLRLLQRAPVEAFFRTTLTPWLHTGKDLDRIAEWIGAGRWTLQQYRPSDKELVPGDKGTFTRSTMETAARRLMAEYPDLAIDVIATV